LECRALERRGDLITNTSAIHDKQPIGSERLVDPIRRRHSQSAGARAAARLAARAGDPGYAGDARPSGAS